MMKTAGETQGHRVLKIQSGGNLMEKRIGSAIILVQTRESVQDLNEIISKHSDIIVGRQGLPRGNSGSIISLVLEGSTDQIGSLTGQLGRLRGIQIKSVLLKNIKDE